MFGYVKKAVHDAMVLERGQLVELGMKQAAEIERLKTERTTERNRMGIKITELNETIEDRDQQIRHAYRQINKRGERGRFVKREMRDIDYVDRRDYNEDETALIVAGKVAEAKAAWHKRTGK